MKIYDISREVFSGVVYPGDPTAQKEELRRIANGDAYNLTAFCMCAHNGTHIDAPFHFLQDGKTVDGVALERCVGFAYVAEHAGVVTGEDAGEILRRAQRAHSEAPKRILIKGDAEISFRAAEIFVDAGIMLLGNESQTVGPENAPMSVHKLLLGAEVVLLEGIRLSTVPQGVYLLNAAPINLAGSDGAPCRAILIEFAE